MELALANDAVGGGNAEYIANITGCTTETVAIAPAGSTCTAVNPAVGCIGVKTGSGGNTNSNAIANFISTHDASATWADGAGGDWKTGKITTTESPSSRIQPVAIVDIPQYLAAGYNGTNGIVRIVNIVGFFIEGTCETVAFKEPYLDCPAHNDKSAVVGRLINYPAMAVSTGGSVTGSFGSVIVLVR